MALTYAPPGEIGTPCPDFHLKSVDGKPYKLADFSQSKILLVAFICNHCPYVKAVEDRILNLAKLWPKDHFAMIGICANDPSEYSEDAPEMLRRRWEEKSYGFPYLIDEPQDTARAFGAVCTPDFFVYDEKRTLRYRGRLDDSWKNPASVQRQELRDAISALIEHKPVNSLQNPAMGCSIKWKDDSR